MSEKINFLGMTLPEILEVVKALNLPKFTARQIADWVYVKRVENIDDMTNISLKNRAVLSAHYQVGRVEPQEVKTSIDGTQKMLFKTRKGNFIESVTIPENNRLTICVSSQAGCKMNCEFCMTGKQGFIENLSSAEIVNQIYSVPRAKEITNVVFMGMGEPLDNYPQVMKAIEIITADYATAWSPRRITLSTIGLMHNVKHFVEQSQCHLAVSLHSPISAQRLQMMPIEKAYPIADVVALLRQYDWSGQRRLSFEYIMLKGKNDSLAHARELQKLLAGLDCRINLIRFHKIPDSTLSPSEEEVMIKFRDFLTTKGFICTIRASRGEDIFAACGMLSTIKKQTNRLCK